MSVKLWDKGHMETGNTDMKNYLRKKLRKWLGIGEISMEAHAAILHARRAEGLVSNHLTAGVEMNFKGNTRIVLMSKLGGGRCEVFDVDCKDVGHLRDVLCRLMLSPDVECIVDAPLGLEKEVLHHLTR